MPTEVLKQVKDERPIFCGIDFSATGREAADVAAAVARKLKTRLILVYVDEFHGLAAVDPTVFEAALSQRRDELEEEAARLRGQGTIVEEKLLSGSVFDELVTGAIECKAQLIVVGAVGHGLARRLLVGSVAERTAETSPIPTLIVRPGGKLASWIRGEHPLRILVGYDFSAAGDAALRWLNGILSLGSCEITVVHVDWPPDEAHRVGYHGPLPLTENPAEIQKFLERDLTQRVAMFLPPENVKVTVEPGWGHPEGYLFEIAQREQIDLIVVGTHHRHGWGRLRFGSVSRTVLHYARVTVAVIPPAELKQRPSLPVLDRVLVATDFSDLGNEAVGYGCALVRRGGRLKVIHVVGPDAGGGPDGEIGKIHARLRSLIPSGTTGRFQIEEDVLQNGDVAAAIREEAERFDADAICVGSKGQTGLTKVFLGSVAQAVMTNGTRPVLVVRGRSS